MSTGASAARRRGLMDDCGCVGCGWLRSSACTSTVSDTRARTQQLARHSWLVVDGTDMSRLCDGGSGEGAGRPLKKRDPISHTGLTSALRSLSHHPHTSRTRPIRICISIPQTFLSPSPLSPLHHAATRCGRGSAQEARADAGAVQCRSIHPAQRPQLARPHAQWIVHVTRTYMTAGALNSLCLCAVRVRV